MRVGKSNIYELLNGTKQYVIPSYQHPYRLARKLATHTVTGLR